MLGAVPVHGRCTESAQLRLSNCLTTKLQVLYLKACHLGLLQLPAIHV